jgi:hypothetical protein
MSLFGKEMNMMTPFKGVKQFTEQVKWNIMAMHNVIIANYVV